MLFRALFLDALVPHDTRVPERREPVSSGGAVGSSGGAVGSTARNSPRPTCVYSFPVIRVYLIRTDDVIMRFFLNVPPAIVFTDNFLTAVQTRRLLDVTHFA